MTDALSSKYAAPSIEVGARETGVMTLLSAVTATGAGTAIDLGSLFSNFTVNVKTTSAATACTVKLQGSINNTDWHDLGSVAMSGTELTALTAMFHVVDKPVSLIRGNMSVFTQAASETVTVTVVGGS